MRRCWRGWSKFALGPPPIPSARSSCSPSSPITTRVPAYPFVVPAQVLAMADLDEVLDVYEQALAEAPRRGSLYAVAKAFRAQAFVLRGDLAEAEAECRDALAASQTWGANARF